MHHVFLDAVIVFCNYQNNLIISDKIVLENVKQLIIAAGSSAAYLFYKKWGRLHFTGPKENRYFLCYITGCC